MRYSNVINVRNDNMQKTFSWQEHYLGLSIVLAFLLPHTNTLFQLVNPLLCLLFVTMNTGRKWSNIVFIPLVPIFMSLMLNIGMAEQKALQSVAIIMLYFAFFPFIGNVRVRNGYLNLCLGVIMLSQIVYMLGIPYIGELFDSIYPISENDIRYIWHVRNNITYETMFDYRLGGLYHNPNQCARSITMLLAFYLVNNEGERMGNIFKFMICAYLGVLITGSRTGFLIATLIVYFAFFRKRRISSNYKFFFGTLAVFSFIYFISSAAGSIRGLDVEGGMSNSAGMKWTTFLYYLTHEDSAISLAFGNLDVSLFEGQYGLAMSSFDSEYGELTYRFGLVGLISVYVFWYMVWKRMDRYNSIFLINLLWTVSSTIVCSFRADFAFMLLLSVLYSKSRSKKGRMLKHSW